MKIKDIKLVNFGIISEESLSFNDGLFVFSGDNGEGKSTFLKAISLLLFNKVNGKLSDYIQWGKDKAEIYCNFSHNGKEYFTDMTLTEKGNQRSLLDKASNYKITSTSGVTEKLDEIFDIKRALISTTSFEHEIDLINTSPSERREYLKRVYDLNFKDELENINVDIKKAEDDSLKLQSEKNILENIKVELEVLDRLPFPEDKLEEKNKEITEIDDLIFNCKSKIDNFKKDKELIKENQKIIDDLNFNLDKFNLRKTKLDNELSELKNKKEESSEFKYKDTLNESITTYETEKNKLLIEKEKLLAEFNELTNKINETHFSEKDFVFKSSKLNNVTNEIKNLSEKESLLAEGKCPTCGTEINISDINSFRLEIESLMLEKSKLLEEVLLLENNKKELDILTKQSFQKETEIKSIESHLSVINENLKDKISFREEDIKNKENEWKEIVKQIDNRIKEIEEDLIDIQKNIDDTFNDLETKKVKQTNFGDLDKHILEEEQKLEVYSFKKTEINELIQLFHKVKSANETKKKVNEKIEKEEVKREERLVALNKEYSEVQEDLEIFKLAKKLLSKDFPSFVLSQLISNIQGFANEFIDYVYPKYPLKFIEAKNSLAVVYGENEIDVKLASGFEKQIFSFAYKYALGKLQNYNILFLDEVDSAASEENSKKFYETIARMSDMFDQIFIITHKVSTKELLKNDFNANIYEIKKGAIV